MVAIVTAGLLLPRECDTQRGVSAEAHASGSPVQRAPGDAGGETATGREAIAARAKLYVDAFSDMRIDI